MFYLEVCDYNYIGNICKYYQGTENLSPKQSKLEIFPPEHSFDTLFENSVVENYFGPKFLNRLKADCV